MLHKIFGAATKGLKYKSKKASTKEKVSTMAVNVNKLEKFGGDKGSIRPESWLKLYELETSKLDEVDRINNLIYYLSKDALEWFADEILSNASIKKWDTVKHKLIQRFGYKVESPIVAASKRRLKKEETVKDYFRDKIRLLNQKSLNNVEKLKMLTDGLPLDWKNYLVTAQPKDPSHWMQIAMEIEQNNNQIRQQQRSKTKVFNITTPTISKNCPYWCPICKKKGLYFKHWISDCKDYDPNYKDKLKHQATNITTDVKQTIADSLCIANTNFPYRFVNVEVLLDNIPVSSFIDTGSTISLMSCSLLKQHKYKLNVNDRIKIKQVDSFAYTLGSVEVFLKIHSKLVRCKLHVVKNFSYPLLIGLDVAGKIGLIIDTKDKAVYVKGNECFYISPETHLPSVQQKELNQLLKENQALFSQHETDIGRIAVQHKIHTIEHPPISCRPYRRPLAEYNEIKRQVEELSKKGLIRESQSPWAFPVVSLLPYIQDMFDRLHNAKYFTTLDIAWGYWHVEMHPDSVEKTAFITNDGHYEFLVMPFGLKNAPSTFQRIIQHIIGNLLWNGVCNYQDDILIYSSTFKDHIELMKKIFDELKENNIKLKLKKCSFAKQEIRYLGHIIGHNKIKPDPEKTKAINEFPQPKTVKQELKSHLSTDPVLSTYDPSLPCKLYTDASKLGIGAILAQIGNDNQEHVISYYSGKLLPHQQNYSAFELECFAVVQSVEYFEVYLENNTFEVITDHSALEWLFNVKKPKAKYLRWIIELSTKSMKIVHRSGSKQMHVDALSRSPVSFHISIPTLRLHQQKADLSFVKNSHIHRDLIMVKHNGVLKTVVPESFQEEILKEYHDNHSHPSINKTVRLITPFYWWPNAIRCIKDYVRSCKICQITKCSHKPFIGEYVAPNSDLKPLELISMDTIVLGSAANETKHKYIQVIIDHLTRFVWAFPTVTNTSQAVIQCLDKINKTVPQIKCILTDNGKNFTSKEFNKFLNEHQVQHTYSTPYHPQSNGLCEKMNDTILTKLRTNLQENPRLK
ncbi:K02A2.6-like [Cordylochernes scorpioides]|uniref:RNA-directed DNA polymerase n=1 Tax=Cordylochernes scorpioides TaxID=51811 RepID=A0ABY6LME2_9ARAC|nr:K02A2.6-like [Cordylochernes scorpioides]